MKNMINKSEEEKIVEDKDMSKQIVISEKNIKKGKIKEMKY